MRGLRRKLKLLEDSDFRIINKKEINKIMVKFRKKKEIKGIPAPDNCMELIEYRMPKLMADDIIKQLKHTNIGKTSQEILCDYVNTEFGLKGYCIKVLVDGN